MDSVGGMVYKVLKTANTVICITDLKDMYMYILVFVF